MSNVVRFPAATMVERTPLVEGANDLDAPNAIPPWVTLEGYDVVNFRVPLPGELFYSPRNDAVVRAKDDSGGRRVILFYREKGSA